MHGTQRFGVLFGWEVSFLIRVFTTLLTVGGFQVLSLRHSAGAKLRNVGGYASYLGGFRAQA